MFCLANLVTIRQRYFVAAGTTPAFVRTTCTGKRRWHELSICGIGRRVRFANIFSVVATGSVSWAYVLQQVGSCVLS
eukprot:COSAG05_NODE_379_length_10567_cov_18.553687_4_plen_77_part_00